MMIVIMKIIKYVQETCKIESHNKSSFQLKRKKKLRKREKIGKRRC